MTLSINLCNHKLICGKRFLERLDIVSNNSFGGIRDYCKSADENPKLLVFKFFVEPRAYDSSHFGNFLVHAEVNQLLIASESGECQSCGDIIL